jgi:hypothetical protein
MSSIGLSQQIEEINYELDQRQTVYGRLVHTNKMRQSVADYHVARMLAVRDTLTRLRDASAEIRAFVALPVDAQKEALRAADAFLGRAG